MKTERFYKIADFAKTNRTSISFSFASVVLAAGAVFALALPLTAAATEYRIVERPRQECWNEQVPVRTGGSDVGGAIIGGIAGGIIGNQIGDGNGRTIATAVGAMTGAVVGDRMSGRSSGSASYQTVQRCRTVYDQVQVPVVHQRVEVIRYPAPVVEQRVYYIDHDDHRYCRHKHHWKHKHWKHHHHHHDDDD